MQHHKCNKVKNAFSDFQSESPCKGAHNSYHNGHYKMIFAVLFIYDEIVQKYTEKYA